MKNIKTAQIVSQAKGSKQTLSQIVVLHIPHSSWRVPAKDRRALRLDDDALSKELLRMTDAYTDALFPLTPVEAGRVIFPVRRLICDVERFPADEDEPMAARGMGVIYRRTSMGEVLRVTPDVADRQSLLDRWYWPHHLKLERMINDVAARSGVCLIVDCHSFSSVPLPHEPDQAADRADICIGTDAFHTPSLIAGALVPLSSYRKERRIMSVMIEVNRRLYMDEYSGLKNQDFGQVCAALGRLIVIAAKAAAQQSSTSPMPRG